MFRNVITVLFVSALILMSGCQSSSGAKPSKKVIPYVEYTSYHNEVLPKIDNGYSVVKHQEYKGPKNISKDEIMATAKKNNADLVMVKNAFGFDEVEFDIYYLQETKVNNKFGAKLVEMPLHIRQTFGSNLGCTLGDISYGTPAYKYDLHKDDIITKANDRVVTSCGQFKKIMKKSKSSLKLELWADGTTYQVNMKIASKSKRTSSKKKAK